MLTVTGEVRRVVDSQYTDKKTGEVVPTAIVIIEPANRRQNYEVHLSRSQLQKGAADTWRKLKGKKASVEVFLYVNHDYRFHKFTAATTGMPLDQGK